MEPEGFEPSSKRGMKRLSTCLVLLWVLETGCAAERAARSLFPRYVGCAGNPSHPPACIHDTLIFSGRLAKVGWQGSLIKQPLRSCSFRHVSFDDRILRRCIASPPHAYRSIHRAVKTGRPLNVKELKIGIKKFAEKSLSTDPPSKIRH